jgi:Tat protein translocase TatB subunit
MAVMFNVGGPELLVILLVALIVLGPQRLPEAARTIGRVVSEVRRVSTGFQEELRSAIDDAGHEARKADAVPLASTVAAVEAPEQDPGPSAADDDQRPTLPPAVGDALGEILGDDDARPGVNGDGDRPGGPRDEVGEHREGGIDHGDERAAS